MDMTKPILEGTFVPVFTPTHDNGDVNIPEIEVYADYLDRFLIKGIVVGGTTGEFATLTVEDRKAVLKEWVRCAAEINVAVIAQVGGVPMPEVLEMAKYAEQLGVDAIMTLPEMYYKPKTSKQLVTYLKAISNAAPTLPLLYYHFPMVSGVEVNMAEFFQMATAEIPNFVGMKADLDSALEVANIMRKDQRVFIGNHLIGEAAENGFQSSIATITNLLPQTVLNMIQAHRIKDMLTRKLIQEHICKVVASITLKGDFLPAMKAAMTLLTGVNVGPPRQPLTALTEEEINELDDRIHELETEQ